MPCLKSGVDGTGRLARRCRAVLFLLCWWPILALSGGIGLRSPALISTDEGYAITAEVDMDLGRSLEEAVMRGVTLTFRLDFELLRPRWYWIDERVASRSQSWQLSYHALTRRYRLSTGALHQNFSNLDDALQVMTRLRHWTVMERSHPLPGGAYRGSLRFQLDTSQLPKPFQLTAIGNRDWELSSDLVLWEVVIDPPVASPAVVPVPAAGSVK
jgi:hypothetical protein